MSEDPMDSPPADHGSDRYGYVEIQNAPEGVTPPDQSVDALLAAACLDCNPNLFMRWVAPGEVAHDPRTWTDENGHRWDLTVAHDQTCPTPHLPKETT